MPAEQVMHKFKAGKLHSGSKKGPIVKSRSQAIAIKISEMKKPKYKAHGSGAFSKVEMDKGFKVECSSTELQRMDPDRLHNLKDYTLANRRNGNSKQQNLHRLED